jgi:hypothetical protein
MTTILYSISILVSRVDTCTGTSPPTVNERANDTEISKVNGLYTVSVCVYVCVCVCVCVCVREKWRLAHSKLSPGVLN